MTDPSLRPAWTAADHAELSVLCYALARVKAYHREHCKACRPDPCPTLAEYRAHKASCPACQGDAPLTHGPPCPHIHQAFVQHGDTCVRCRPCPHIRRAVEVVVDWHHARSLLSQAQALRAERDALEAVA